MKFISSFSVAGLGLVAVMDEWTGKELYERIPYLAVNMENCLFDFFSKSDAYRLVNAFRNPNSEEDLLKPPFSPDRCGSTGDCIIFMDGKKIRNLAVSLRNEVRISEHDGFSAYGEGKVFIKIKAKIDCEFIVKVDYGRTIITRANDIAKIFDKS